MNLVLITGARWARYEGRKFLEAVEAEDDCFTSARQKLATVELFRKEGYREYDAADPKAW